MRRARAGVMAIALCLAGARTASACAVCFSAAEEARGAYYGTTALLGLLPFLLLASILYWLRRVARSREATLEGAHAAERVPTERIALEAEHPGGDL